MTPPSSFHCNLLVLLFLLSLLSPVRQVSARNLPTPRHAAHPRDQDQPISEPLSPAGIPRPSSQVLTSCAHARYPSLCVRTLSSSQLPADSTPADLALAAVSASSTSARGAAAFLSRLLNATSPAPVPLKDCREQLSDSADQLEKTAKEIHRLRRETFRWQLDNAQTWASAAMTNQDTCVQGLQGGGPGASAGPLAAGGAASAVAADTRDAVVKRVSGVSQLTSNALYLINCLARTTGRGRIRSP